jgi:hypothetical protein
MFFVIIFDGKGGYMVQPMPKDLPEYLVIGPDEEADKRVLRMAKVAAFEIPIYVALEPNGAVIPVEQDLMLSAAFDWYSWVMFERNLTELDERRKANEPLIQPATVIPMNAMRTGHGPLPSRR